MMISWQELSVSRTLKQFDDLKRAVIDTSSLIYLDKIKLLHETRTALELITVPGVVKEFQQKARIQEWAAIRVHPVDCGNGCTTDSALLAAAKALTLPVISEDRQLLMKARAAEIPYFNTLMIIFFLLYRKTIPIDVCEAAVDHLERTARYDTRIFDYGRRVKQAITDLHASENKPITL